HLGHGNTTPDDLGFIAETDGDVAIVDDLFEVTKVVESEHPDIPHILLGHSMGSFVARRYITKYGDHLDGAIIVGTGNQSPMSVRFGLFIANYLCRHKGTHYVSPFLNKVILESNDKRFDEPEMKNRWISRDPESVRRYNEDPFCTFRFTSAGFRDLLTMIRRIESREDFDRIPRDLPIILLSGSDDPIGDFGKGVEKAKKALEDAGLRPEMKLYPGARHEILNETNRQEVYSDILAWIERVIDH
ncbi:MAG: alpha/beta fold hydrolase, partial [Candidatus Methanomethylophilaceae archaeon]|nr:alpha/beta fold hydrolase [Candidatus Methanomethylophilaceae archaeon]